MKAYSKPSGPVIKAKTGFFTRNDALHRQACAINHAYAGEAPRRACMTCLEAVGPADLVSFGVGYALCGTCGHLNGIHDDSAAFADALYAAEDGNRYKANYLDGYDDRVRDIYGPKADFLLKTLAEQGLGGLELGCQELEGLGSGAGPSVLDVGCGAGHFVRALEERGITATGLDPNAALIDLGQTRLTANTLELVTLEAFPERMADSDSAVISMIGVLEHLRAPRAALDAFARSKAEVLFISVPLFSLSVFLEHAFPGIYPRHLSGGHTHLYSPESLDWLERTYGLRRIGEWWFGADMIDLYRSLAVTLKTGGASAAMLEAFDSRFAPMIDALQGVLDQNHLCSEVHLVWSKA